jgi:hypothetical protein
MRTFLSTAAALAVAFVMLPLAACSSSSDAQPAIAKTCTKTACDEKTSRDSSASCSGEELSQCVQQGFTVRIDDAPSADVLAACNRMFDHFESCNVRVDGKTKSICAIWAKAEKPESAAFYDCIANEGCNDDPNDCALPTTDFGDDLCNRMASKCGSDVGTVCDTVWRKPLNDNGGAWRGDIISLGRKCLDYPNCSDVIGCQSAWTVAVGL